MSAEKRRLQPGESGVRGARSLLLLLPHLLKRQALIYGARRARGARGAGLAGVPPPHPEGRGPGSGGHGEGSPGMLGGRARVRNPGPPERRARNGAPGAARPRASCGGGSSGEDLGGDLGRGAAVTASSGGAEDRPGLLTAVSCWRAAASVRGSPNSSRGDGRAQASWGPSAAPGERPAKPGVGGPAGGHRGGRGARPRRLRGKFLTARGAEPRAGATQVPRSPVGREPRGAEAGAPRP